MTTEMKAKQAETTPTNDVNPHFIEFIAKRLESEARKMKIRKKPGEPTYAQAAQKIAEDVESEAYKIFSALYEKEGKPKTADDIVAAITAELQNELGKGQEAPAPTSPAQLTVVPNAPRKRTKRKPDRQKPEASRPRGNPISEENDDRVMAAVTAVYEISQDRGYIHMDGRGTKRAPKGAKKGQNVVYPWLPETLYDEAFLTSEMAVMTVRRVICSLLAAMSRELDMDNFQEDKRDLQDLVFAMSAVMMKLRGNSFQQDQSEELMKSRRDWPMRIEVLELLERGNLLEVSEEVLEIIQSELEKARGYAARRGSDHDVPPPPVGGGSNEQALEVMSPEVRGERRLEFVKDVILEMLPKDTVLTQHLVLQHVRSWDKMERRADFEAALEDNQVGAQKFFAWAAVKYNTGAEAEYGKAYAGMIKK